MRYRAGAQDEKPRLSRLMRPRPEFFLEGLISLDRYNRADRRTVFRQSFASIGRALPGQAPLEGCDESALARSVRAALADGLLDDLGWLAAPAAGVALYAIAGALPLGVERRELGRMVLAELYGGDAATFVAIAAHMASSGSARAIAGAGIRARVALAFGLPSSANVARGSLALALIGRRELAAAWLGARAIGSLPERRLAARLLETAAREAADRARLGDEDPVRLFYEVIRADGSNGAASPETVGGAFRALLADRETLVWRHVAVARGLLARSMPDLAAEIDASLATHLSPTEWRRGATSLVASIAFDPERALRAALSLHRGPIVERDPGVATAMLWGLPRASDAEPEAATELLEALSRAAPLLIAEDLTDIRAELGDAGKLAADRCAAAVQEEFRGKPGEEEARALAERLREELADCLPRGVGVEGESRPDVRLRTAIEYAVDGFVESGTREAHARAQMALARAAEVVAGLELLQVNATAGLPTSARGLRKEVILVRELDMQILASGTLKNLLLLSRGPGDTAVGVLPIDELDERLAAWLLAREAAPLTPEGESSRLLSHQRRLRALLHLIDGEATEFEDDQERRDRMHGRWTATCRLLLSRLALPPSAASRSDLTAHPTPPLRSGPFGVRAQRVSDEREMTLRRAVAATVGRALDALVRDGAADPADVLLYAAFRARGPADLSVLGEASMNPEVWRLLRAYARFVDAEDGASPDSEVTPSRVSNLEGLILDLPSGGSQRIEAIRGALSRLARALISVLTAKALRPLADPETSPLGALSEALEKLGQLTASALRRCGGEDEPIPILPSPAFPLAAAVARALQVGRIDDSGANIAAALRPVLAVAIERIRACIPRGIAEVVVHVLPAIGKLPVDWEGLPLRTPRSPSERIAEGPLPAWMPSRRTLGGFYVHRQIGGGASGTVFVVTRAEERHDPGAERFALKVPAYDATAARSLSETDFLKLFREEAGALLSVPEHENLARFVTFDAGARPVPILVMELIEGTRCDKLIASRLLTLDGAFLLLDGVLAGLSAMHSVGVGHLDVKPSNVVLRGSVQPVLVDFGLAGHHLRPGCGTSSYGAPEVWGIMAAGPPPTPMMADMYSFGCLAYEVLTGETLFDAPNEVALISAHLTHDGQPPAIRRLSERPTTKGLAAWLHRCLRKDPCVRATAVEIRSDLPAAAASLERKTWPVPA